MKIKNIFYFLKLKNFKNRNFYIKIFNRNILINKNMINLKLAVYNGKYFIPFRINVHKLNNLLGAFSFSKSILIKNIKKKRKRNKKKKKKKKKKKWVI